MLWGGHPGHSPDLPLNDSALAARLQTFSIFAAAAVCLLALLVLAGWYSGLGALKSFIPGAVAMNPITAMLLTLSAVTLYRIRSGRKAGLHRQITIVCSSIILLEGALRLAQYLFDWQVGLDRILFSERLGSNQIAPNTAFTFGFVGLSFLLIDSRRRLLQRVQTLFITVVLGIALMAIMGYVFGSSYFYGIGSHIPMALPTAIAFAILSLGILCARPDQEPAVSLRSDTAGAAMMRRLLPAAVLVPFLLGWLMLKGEKAALYDYAFGIALFALSIMIFFSWFITKNASLLHRAELARRSIEQERDRFFTVSLDMFCIAGFDGYFKRLSRSWENALGFTIAELKSKPFLEFIHPDDRQTTQKEAAKIQGGQTTISFENRYLTKDGTYKWLLWNAVPLLEQKQIYAIARDITHRKQMEDELRATNAFLDSVVENIPDMIFVKDALNLRFVRFNKAAEELLGYSRQELLGKNVYDLFPAGEADFFTNSDRAVLQGRSVVDIAEAPVHARGKGIRILHTKKIPIIDPAGRRLFLLGISEDITERKKAEEEIRSLNEQLQAKLAELTILNHDLESFSYSVSHDLRSPIRHIDGFTGLLKKNIDSLLDEKNRRYLNLILESTARMGKLIDDLLLFSQMGRSEFRKTAVSMESLVKEVLRNLEQDCQDRNINWKIGDLPKIEGDAALLRQVWTNLISNALKYTSTKDHTCIEIGSTIEDHRTTYYVKDNGVGFDMKYIDKLFGVFQRLHSSEEFEGTGIGLASVRRIIQRHGGQTWAEGFPGAGAIVYFSIPNHDSL